MTKQRAMILRVSLLGIAIATGGCNRYYAPSNDFDVTSGVNDCKALCKSWGMEMFGIVALHDTNSGCMCRAIAGAAADGGN